MTTTDTAPLFLDPGNPPDTTDWPVSELETVVAQADPVDPDAPFGINPNTGRPYRMSPEERKAAGEKLAAGRAAAKAASRPAGKRGPGRPPGPAKAARPAAKPAGPNYRPAATAVLMLPATVAAVLGKVTGNRAFLADSAAITAHTPALADAAHDMALEDPRVAAVLDKIGQVSPYGAFAAALGVLVIQIAANHRLAPISPELGIVSVDELIGAGEE